jgi:putative transcriptional regulator
MKHLLGHIMNIEQLTAHAIAAELGDRIKTARLNANLTQKALANKAGLSLKAVTNGEKGKSTLESMIAILIALGLTEQLNSFIPKQEVSPVQLIELQGKERKRATTIRKSTSKINTESSSRSKDIPTW